VLPGSPAGRRKGGGSELPGSPAEEACCLMHLLFNLSPESWSSVATCPKKQHRFFREREREREREFTTYIRIYIYMYITLIYNVYTCIRTHVCTYLYYLGTHSSSHNPRFAAKPHP
jgi:hypothetical protein